MDDVADVLEKSVEKLHEVFDRSDFEVEWMKIRQKMEEARYSPGAVTPLVDCIYSLFLAARSQGFHVSAVLAELKKVSEENLHRQWKRMPDGTHRAT